MSVIIYQSKFQTALYKALKEDSDINYLVNDRYYNSRLPQNSLLPAITFQMINIEATEDKDGPSEYDIVKVQFNAYAYRLADAQSIVDCLRKKFDRYKAVSDVEFHNTFFSDTRPSSYNDDYEAHFITMDFDFHIKNI